MQEQEPMTKVVRQLRSGQITIPAEFRKRLGIEEAALLQITLHGGQLHIKPVQVKEAGVGSPWLKELYELFAPVRDEARQLSEEEVNTAIDDAVQGVRQRHA